MSVENSKESNESLEETEISRKSSTGTVLCDQLFEKYGGVRSRSEYELFWQNSNDEMPPRWHPMFDDPGDESDDCETCDELEAEIKLYKFQKKKQSYEPNDVDKSQDNTEKRNKTLKLTSLRSNEVESTDSSGSHLRIQSDDESALHATRTTSSVYEDLIMKRENGLQNNELNFDKTVNVQLASNEDLKLQNK